MHATSPLEYQMAFWLRQAFQKSDTDWGLKLSYSLVIILSAEVAQGQGLGLSFVAVGHQLRLSAAMNKKWNIFDQRNSSEMSISWLSSTLAAKLASRCHRSCINWMPKVTDFNKAANSPYMDRNTGQFSKSPVCLFFCVCGLQSIQAMPLYVSVLPQRV